MEQLLNNAREQFDSWKESHTHKLKKLQEKCSQDAQTSEDRIRELYKQQMSLLAQAKDVAESQGVQAELLTDVDHKIAQLNTKLQEVMSGSVKTEHMIAAEEKKIAEAKRTLKSYKENCEQFRLEKDLGVLTYEKRLGLRFERVEEDHLRVVFTQIDPKDPDKEFQVIVCVDQNHLFQFPERFCKPLLFVSRAWSACFFDVPGFGERDRSLIKSCFLGFPEFKHNGHSAVFPSVPGCVVQLRV